MRVAQLCRAAVLGACFAAGLSSLAPDPAAAQGRIVARHGDWQIRCETPVGAPAEQCALVQNVEAQDRQNVGLTVIFLRTADRQAEILRVLAPLGVLLPSGLGLSIDGNEIGLAGFVRCLPEGCIAEVELDDGLKERFAGGNTATFVIFQTPEEGIGIPISLKGFTTGFAALDNPPPPPSDVAAEPAVPQPAVATLTERVSEAAAVFEEPADTRSELDRLLEDPMLPYVAAGAVLIFAVVLVTVLLMRGRKRKATRRAAADKRDRRGEPGLGVPDRPGDDLAAFDTDAAPDPRTRRPAIRRPDGPRQLPARHDDLPRH